MIISVKKAFSLTIIFCGLIIIQSFGQKKDGIFSRKKIVNQYSTVGIGGGSSHYFGDLAPYTYAYYGLYTNVRWNGTINYTRYLSEKLAARASFTYARIYGDDYTFSNRNIEKLASQAIRNLHFRNDLKEFTVSGIYNLLPQYNKGPKGRNTFMPFVSAGLGFYGHNPKAILRTSATQTYSTKDERKDWVALYGYNTSGQNLPGSTIKKYSLVQIVAPVSVGFRIKVGKSWDFSAEAGFRYTPTDYLDDVGNTVYPDFALLEANFGLNAPLMSYRANEDFHAASGANRISQFLNAATIKGMVTSSGTSPSLNSENIYPTSSLRGSKRLDSYVLTQFTISYVLSNNIKCPVIR
ncbi:MAG: hypothetical protein IPQ23_04430 [Cytophagaceae bacterium]|nr:hypothetical protein [Cytophagaceae bacterium]